MITKRKSKQLKDYTFQLDHDMFRIFSVNYKSIHLTKREALALLRFLLGEMELTEKQWESIYNIARAKYLFLKETP